MAHVVKWAADIASILTCLFVIFGYLSWRWGRHKKAKRLEGYLRQEKLKGGKGQRTALHIIRHVGLTEDEAIQASFDNPKIGRRITEDEKTGLARDLLFEYQS